MGEILILKGADINAKDIDHLKMRVLLWIKVIYYIERKFIKNNWAPLHYAAYENSKDIGDILIAKGAEVDVKDIRSLRSIKNI